MRTSLTITSLLLCIAAMPQWECRSNLTGHLKPLYEGSSLNWAAEVNGSSGILSDNTFANSMLFLGLDYTKNNHQLYFEGGAKYWYLYEPELSAPLSNSMLGLRELSYNYFSQNTDINLGLQQIQLADFTLVNERAWGGSVAQKVGKLQLKFDVASVTKDFARNGTFCSNGFIYDIVPTRNLPLGNNWGETNFAAVSFKKEAGGKNQDNASDEFSEFETYESFGEPENSSHRFLLSYGGFVYSEFGTYYSVPQLYAGLTGEFSLSNIANVKAQGIYQNVSDNKALLLYLKAEKLVDWTAGDISTINASFLGKLNIDDNALAMPRFSNLLMGEVLRMDMTDIPLINLTAKHQFAEKKMSCKLAYTHQLKGLNMQELDFSVGKYFFNKHLRTTMITGFMDSEELDKATGLAKLEMRLFF